MAKVFISYRRDDTTFAVDLIEKHLKGTPGIDNVFRDVASIPGGAEWQKTIRSEVLAADVVLAVIGSHWLGTTDPEGKARIFNDGDWVRYEVALALAERKKVIPVCVHGVPVPEAKSLPKDLQKLPERHRLLFRTGVDQEADLMRLATAITGPARNWKTWAIAAVLLTAMGAWPLLRTPSFDEHRISDSTGDPVGFDAADWDPAGGGRVAVQKNGDSNPLRIEGNGTAFYRPTGDRFADGYLKFILALQAGQKSAACVIRARGQAYYKLILRVNRDTGEDWRMEAMKCSAPARCQPIPINGYPKIQAPIATGADFNSTKEAIVFIRAAGCRLDIRLARDNYSIPWNVGEVVLGEGCTPRGRVGFEAGDAGAPLVLYHWAVCSLGTCPKEFEKCFSSKPVCDVS